MPAAATVSPAQRVLLGGGALLFVDSFLPWQRSCISLAPDFPLACSQSGAWTGNGFFAGSLMSILALLLILVVGATLVGLLDAEDERLPRVINGLAIGAVVFGAIKFLYAVVNHWAYGAWIGFALVASVAYGGYRKMQEDNAIPGR